MHVDDELGQMVVCCLVGLVAHHEEKIETRHDGGAQVDVVFERLALVVSAENGIGSCQDAGAGVESGVDSSFGD